MIDTTDITVLHLSISGTKDNLQIRKRKCVNKKGYLWLHQTGKRDNLNTKEYRLLAHPPTQLRHAPECLYVRLTRYNIHKNDSIKTLI
jgi:hypothetical protein